MSRSWFRFVVLVLACSACTADLAEIETRQQALRREVDVLALDVARMRRKMQEMGVLPAGPIPNRKGGPAALIDLGATFSQQGSPPELPPLGPVERRPDTACGYRMRSVALAEISDRRLSESGSGNASPIKVTYEGRELTPHAGPARSENGCHGAFRVQPRFIFLSPFEADAVDGEWKVELMAEQPVRRGNDGLGVVWVYPGTSVEYRFKKGWDAGLGEFGVHLDARLMNVGTAPTRAARVEVLGVSAEATEGRLGVSAEATEGRLGAPDVAPPNGPWSMQIMSPPDGPYVLIESLWVGNAAAGHQLGPVSGASL